MDRIELKFNNDDVAFFISEMIKVPNIGISIPDTGEQSTSELALGDGGVWVVVSGITGLISAVVSVLHLLNKGDRKPKIIRYKEKTTILVGKSRIEIEHEYEKIN